MRTEAQIAEDYKTYRGKCKQYCESAVKADPKLKMVRGYVFVPLWATEEPHWWCVKEDGSIYDPTVLQFPMTPFEYTEFDGIVYCCQCDKQGTEEDFISLGSGDYMACSNSCAMRFVGL